jgi:hypothetical protein
MRRVVKVSFRWKEGARQTVKVYVTVRRDGVCHPTQLHLGYLPDGDTIPAPDKARLSIRLKEKWSHLFGSKDVRIDWKAAMERWQERGERKRSEVDREAVLEQLKKWRSGDPEVVTPILAGHPRGEQR